jgi:hypothetical protein
MYFQTTPSGPVTQTSAPLQVQLNRSVRATLYWLDGSCLKVIEPGLAGSPVGKS